jgi:hypothetical protein
MDTARTARIEFDGRPAWRKRYGAPERRLRKAMMRWLMRRFGLWPLVPPLPLDAAQACRTEYAMIRQLAACGACVPEVLSATATELVLSDLGETLSARCKAEPDESSRSLLLRKGLDALAELHGRGGYLSQAFARNLILSGDRIGFIDLEEDPLTIMPLAAAQARDLLLFVHSTARFLGPREYSRLLTEHMAREAEPIAVQVANVARRLAWLAPLARLGGVRSRGVAMAISTLARARPCPQAMPLAEPASGPSELLPAPAPAASDEKLNALA